MHTGTPCSTSEVGNFLYCKRLLMVHAAERVQLPGISRGKVLCKRLGKQASTFKPCIVFAALFHHRRVPLPSYE